MTQFESEKALLQGLATRDKAAVEQVYRKHYHMIQSMVIHNNGTGDDAADIFQETMIVLYEKSMTDGFELNCQLKTYIYSIARRLWLKRLSTAMRYAPTADSAEEVIAVEEDLEFHERRQTEFSIMEQALSKMGEPCKSLLEAYYLQKKPMQQIASEFGYTNSDNAKTQKYKCLVRLKKLFFQQYKNL